MNTPSTEDHTPEELRALDNGFEWINGQLVEKNKGMEASRVMAKVITRLDSYASANALGHVLGSKCSYQIFAEEPKRVQKAAGSFIARSRLPGERLVRGHCRIPPDLAVEVISPNDMAEDVNARVTAFLTAGVRLLWVIYPATRTIHVFRQGGGAAWLTAADQLSGEDVIPGFVCRVEEVFPGL
jgi:Uma2 family endonuclease